VHGVWRAELIKFGGIRQSRPTPWVARITASDKRWKYKREFINPIYDYSNASNSGKGTVLYFALAPGVYEVYYPVNIRWDVQKFIKVLDNGDIEDIGEDEVNEWLKTILGAD
jgi:hypothetical protein